MSQPYHPENYWDTVAENILSRQDNRIIAGDDEPYYRYKRNRILECIDSFDFKDQEVLEIGSGPGGNLEHIYLKGCKKITGVDISCQMIALSRKLLAGKPIEIIQINGEKLPFEDNTFDIVFTVTVLQHNTDELHLNRLIQEICRVSRDTVLLFERIESKIKGHETNLGRPVNYYSAIFNKNHFSLKETRSLPIQASYYVCGVIRKLFNSSGRKEGESISTLSRNLMKMVLPITSRLDHLIPSKRDVMLLIYKKSK